MTKITNAFLSLLPPTVLDVAVRENGEHRFRAALAIQLHRFALRLLNDPEKLQSTVNKAKKKGKVMVIREVYYPTKTFSCYLVFEVLGLMLFCLSRGRVPVIQLNRPNEKNLDWSEYFAQPFMVNLDSLPFRTNDCPLRCSPYKPSFNLLTLDQKERSFWRYFAQVSINPSRSLADYIKREMAQMPIPRAGLLIRGTDYTKLRPKGHPCQPEPHVLLDWVSEMKHNEALYVATEDKSLFDLCVERFGESSVYSNERTYIDGQYSAGDYRFISEIPPESFNSSYLERGFQYLSSLWILMESEEVFFALSGGALFVYLLRPSLNGLQVMDCGFYE